MKLPGPKPPDIAEWTRRRDAAERCFSPWLDRMHGLAGTTILEYGCGSGPVAAALAPRVARYIGYDIDPAAVRAGQVRLDHAGVAARAELHAAPADRIADAVAEHRGEPDVVLLYAVLEHLTTEERLRVLELAFDVVKPDGLVAVIESPNRLATVDWHTSFLPFLCQLPEPLAVAYSERSQRDDFREAMVSALAAGPDAAREELTRWGRGISFHEFELVLGDVGDHVIGGGYDPDLLGERPIHPEEQILARQLQRSRPDLPPVFGRYWLDIALTREPRSRPTQGLIRPWIMETRLSPGARWTRWETIELDAEAPLQVELPSPTDRIVVAVALPEAAGEVRLEADGLRLRSEVAAAPGQQAYADFELPRDAARLWLSLSHPGHLHFVGYAAPSAG